MTPDYPDDWTTSKKHKADVLIYVIGMMEDLKDEGVISGGYEMSEEGYEQYRRLRDSGFEPTEEELKSTMAFVYQSADKPTAAKPVAVTAPPHNRHSRVGPASSPRYAPYSICPSPPQASHFIRGHSLDQSPK